MDLVNEKAAAEFLSVSTKTLQNARVSGMLGNDEAPAFFKLGGSVRYDLAELAEYVKSRRRISTS